MEYFFSKLFFSFLKPEFSQKVTSKSPQTTYNDGADNNCCCWKIMDRAKVIGVAIMLSGVGGATIARELEEAD